MDDTDADFRSRVEQIRQIGGDSWLKIFDEIQGEEEMTQVLLKTFKFGIQNDSPSSEINLKVLQI